MEVRHLEGALGRPDPNGGVLTHLEARYVMYSVGSPIGPVTAAAIEERLGEIRAAAEPWLAAATYFNFADGDVDPRDLYPGDAFERLAAIRVELDPDGLFRSRHAI